MTADDTAQRESRLLPTFSAPLPNGKGAVFLDMGLVRKDEAFSNCSSLFQPRNRKVAGLSVLMPGLESMYKKDRAFPVKR